MLQRGLLIIICCFYLIGCSHRVPLENVSLMLLIALDRTDSGEMLVGTSIPLFHHETQRTTVEHFVKASSLYEGFSKIGSKMTGFVTPSKAEIILIGKTFAEKENWMEHLDSFYRDPYSTINAKVILVDGSTEDIFHVKSLDKPMFPSYIDEVIESSIENNQAVSSTIQQLIRENNEEGMTQTVPIIIRKKNHIDTVGIGFLDHHGKYVARLPKKDVVFFNLMNRSRKKGRMILHLDLKPLDKEKQPNASILVQDAKRKVKINYHKEKFVFSIDIYMNVAITERLNTKMIKNNENQKQEIRKMEHELQVQLDRKLNNIAKHMQKYRIDPMGLGLYAAAYEYKQWKKVGKYWSSILPKGEIHIKTHVKISNTGINRG